MEVCEKGYLFRSHSPQIQVYHPLVGDRIPFSQKVSTALWKLLEASLHSKDWEASAATRSTTSGILGSVHGVLHESRTLLAFLLCAWWGGNVPPTD
jgi:hypothetical protein